ncbi:hypothetical protein ANCCEY_02830 [Ancylostoma ceylanicum]|uniref:G-protein coupled receptors family 1 profile domain-containing protein n=1 Tax=Ancylostoma ceylanicum TaxID=53326 RepID=A0A0D6M3M9_9BILA|nr:hypothetical protein ANCCEY_02830 [Ancylostoma ceylanicum]
MAIIFSSPSFYAHECYFTEESSTGSDTYILGKAMRRHRRLRRTWGRSGGVVYVKGVKEWKEDRNMESEAKGKEGFKIISGFQTNVLKVRKKRLLRMLVIMVVIFAVCWFPFNFLEGFVKAIPFLRFKVKPNGGVRAMTGTLAFMAQSEYLC